MKIKSLFALLTLVGAFLFTSCSTTKYTVDLDSTIDFTKYKSFKFYGWAEESNKLLTPFDQERIEKAFGAEFDKRSIKHEQETGDLIVTLHIVTEQKTRTTASTTTTGMGGYGGYGGYYGHGPSYGWGGAGMGMSTSHTTYNEYDYVVGTLIVDIFDSKGEKLIWESVAKGEINNNTKNREARIISTVSKMMITYPVKPTK